MSNREDWYDPEEHEKLLEELDADRKEARKLEALMVSPLRKCFFCLGDLITFLENEGFANDLINEAKKAYGEVQRIDSDHWQPSLPVEVEEVTPVEVEEVMGEDDFVQAGIVAREVVKKTAKESAQEWIDNNPEWVDSFSDFVASKSGQVTEE